MGIFSSDHARKLLHNKFIVIIGDSVQRSAYKDLVVLLQENRFIKDKELRTKGETSFCNDRLVHRSELTNGTNYQEIREYKTDNYLIRFYFITRIFNKCVKTILDDFMDKEQPTPDVVFVNSCLWDISRYGRNSKKEYINNLEKFCTELDKCVPIETCIVWRTTLPVSQRARGGFLSKEIANCTNTLVVDVLLANHLAHTIITRHKYDVVDMHFLFTQQQQRREKDGVHWNMFAHRRMTNIFLTHIAEAWGLGVPVPPSYNDADVIFDPRDISMNTTEVLQHAYTPENVHRPTAEEVRYGGPIRSPNEMFNLYSSFYNVPQEIHLHDAEVYNEYDDIANYMQQYSSEVYRQRTLNLHEHAVRASLTAPGQTIHSNNLVLHNNNFHSNNAAEWTRKVHYEENYMRPPKQARQKKFRLHPYRQLHR